MTSVEGVVTLITRLVILYIDWSSGWGYSSVALHLSFLHSLSPGVTDPCRRLTSSIRAGSLVTCHRLLRRFFRRCSSLTLADIEVRGSSHGRHLGVDGARACRTASEKFSTRVDYHPIVQFRIERNMIFQVSLEVGQISAPEIRAIRWVMKG